MQDHQESLALLSLRQASLLTDAVSVQVVHVAQTGAESGGSAFPSIQSTLGGQSSLSRCVMLHSDLSVILTGTLMLHFVCKAMFRSCTSQDY